MKTIKLLLICLALLLGLNSYSQNGDQGCKTATKTIKGIYRGKNLFFQNDLENGIQKILIDDKVVVSNLTSTAFELPLSSLKLKQKFVLKIVYCTGTKNPYKLVNPENIK